MSSKTIAKVIGDALVINLQTATEKSIWRCSMDQLNHAVFIVKAKGKKHILLLKIVDNEEIIASFESEEEAESVLKIVTKALLTPVFGVRVRKNPWFRRFIYVLLFIGLIYIGIKFAGPLLFRNAMVGQPPITAQQSYAPNSKIRMGVPMSADEMFGN